MRVEVVDRNSRARGSECIVFGSVSRTTDLFKPIALDMRDSKAKAEELSSYGAWDVRPMLPSPDLETAPALVSVAAQGAYCRTTGRLVVVSHAWSGVLRAHDIGRQYLVDLYSETTRLVLMDLIHGIVADVTSLAVVENGALALPALPIDRIASHIVEEGAWFRFVDPDAGFKPSLSRLAIEAFRPRPGEALRQKLMTGLLPRLAASRSPPASAPPPPLRDEALRDEMRCLAAAVDGLALRALSQA